MKIIVDMNEFSKTFADEIRLCTLCDHGLCPGSEMVASLRCRECGHYECNGCSRHVDEKGEEWCVCCSCGTGNDEFGGEPHRNVGAENVSPRHQDGLQTSQTSQTSWQSEGTECVQSHSVSSSTRADCGFSVWLVGGGVLEAPATRMQPLQKQ